MLIDRRTFFKMLAAATAAMAVPALAADTSVGAVTLLPPSKIPLTAIWPTLRMLLEEWRSHFGCYPARDSADWLFCELMARLADDVNLNLRRVYEESDEFLLDCPYKTRLV